MSSIAAPSLNNLAQYYYDNKDYEKTLLLSREALVFLPDYHKARLKLIRVLFELKRIPEAIQAVHQAIDRDPKNKDMVFYLFFVLFEQKQYAEAEKVYHHYLTLNPQAATAHFYLGLLALAQGAMRKPL